MSYFDYILSYIINNPKYTALLVLVLLAGIAYLFKRKKSKSKYKKSTTSYTNNNSSSSTFTPKPHNKNYIPEHSTQHSQGSNFFVVESVSQVFESKMQGRSR
ncbi:hypothetical protein ECHHL_0892 [Ehrlichia chaffeensis str. Heartland]|nr:hypothetical protein [Ehrlichia chaffeensis]AHX04025.1 hypothetical protein ECHHL_0892 [Ehrlichia chaffeensis str. Heartland]AHX05959.1 hypothetical protein ECHJAX_0909 [Ehrlichia chaffeensis str. Jax]AHX06949.1 hypothetical protein ECHLIB_0912 [Ehrlichia chaffeensis str. Liberty]AHX08660.1 hypothetical protein ECHSTV_0898 [Ehrlichia chaffeensis str. Saint Vincent]AHX09984.1 hypothetical protein ECHWAK_0908 [Ehrlichia chaffeensis str. Wakulla]